MLFGPFGLVLQSDGSNAVQGWVEEGGVESGVYILCGCLYCMRPGSSECVWWVLRKKTYSQGTSQPVSSTTLYARLAEAASKQFP